MCKGDWKWKKGRGTRSISMSQLTRFLPQDKGHTGIQFYCECTSQISIDQCKDSLTFIIIWPALLSTLQKEIFKSLPETLKNSLQKAK